MEKYQKRVFVSFDGYCPMRCRHCYTYELANREHSRSCQKLVDDLMEKEFDVIYLSQTYENFFEEQKGIDLCKALYQKYEKDIYIITRSRLSEEGVAALSVLNQNMRKRGNKLYFAVSVCGNESYGITEDIFKCPTPLERLDNLRRLHEKRISTILLVRPLFPDQIIRLAECKALVNMASGYADAVISSGLVVTDVIIKRLGLNTAVLKYGKNGNSDYLANINSEQVRYLDVERELTELGSYCESLRLPFFKHSMPALNYLAEQS